MTRNPNDVSACAAVGNINAQAMRSPLMAQNQAVGLNANFVLNTGAGGVAYRCEKGKAIPGQ
jgi:hypothetical protein